MRRAAIKVMGGLMVVMFAGVTLGRIPSNNAGRMAGKENPVSAIQISVTGGGHNKPIDNASVYVRYDEPRFLLHPRHIELDLKTDQAGIAKVNDVPRVKILIQVVKDGWKPFGQYYVLEKEQEKIEIHMKPPAHWY